MPNFETGHNSCECVKDIIVGVFDIEGYLQDAMRRGDFNRVFVKLTDDITAPKFDSLFDKSNKVQVCSSDEFSKLEAIKLANQNWFIQVTPNRNFLLENYSWSPWQLLVGGMFLTGFLSIGLLVLTGHTELVAAQVDRRTLELSQSNRKLAARERQFRKLVQTQSAIADGRIRLFSALFSSVQKRPVFSAIPLNNGWMNRISGKNICMKTIRNSS